MSRAHPGLEGGRLGKEGGGIPGIYHGLGLGVRLYLLHTWKVRLVSVSGLAGRFSNHFTSSDWIWGAWVYVSYTVARVFLSPCVGSGVPISCLWEVTG